MELLSNLGIILFGYILGAIPFGYIFVRLFTGKDIRQVQSGRSGGTNAMRAAGLWAGLGTGVLDVLKAYYTVQIAKNLVPDTFWVHALAAAAVIVGHNYSIFLAHRDEQGRWRLRGGAGGATVLGGSMGFWTPALYIILPIGALIYYFVGYASVTTLSAGVMATILFAIRASLGLGPWEYALYGLLATILVMIALQPNIRALRAGTERLHGYRARKQKQASER